MYVADNGYFDADTLDAIDDFYTNLPVGIMDNGVLGAGTPFATQTVRDAFRCGADDAPGKIISISPVSFNTYNARAERVAATPGRGYSVVASRRRRGRNVDISRWRRGAAAAGTWIFRGGVAAAPRPGRGYSAVASRRRRGHDVDIPREVGARLVTAGSRSSWATGWRTRSAARP